MGNETACGDRSYPSPFFQLTRHEANTTFSHLLQAEDLIIRNGSFDPTIRINSTSFGLLFLIIRLGDGGPFEAVCFVKPLISVYVDNGRLR
ncbi:hypothetical protein AVEN_211853-1 [Araneus ventricosus]|uniref:Uncharacterized protein n=1 Tax=Araneus ventricosus TaxID=182803 RepID=A0A4Y2KKG1_ARAVE|nr:hypothetical protein AVEN_211853-1 [Araneus ventricosus]